MFACLATSDINSDRVSQVFISYRFVWLFSHAGCLLNIYGEF